MFDNLYWRWYSIYSERNKEVNMRNVGNTILRNLLLKKKALKAAGFDVGKLDTIKKVDDAFKKSGLPKINTNNMGVA